jgi:protein subunit release factor A
MANRVSTEHVEVAVVPNTQKGRVSTEAVEVAVVPNTQKARVSQEYIEVAIKDSVVGGAGGARFYAQVIG